MELDHELVTVEMVREMHAYLLRSTGGDAAKAQSYLAGRLNEREGRREAFEDLQKHLAAKPAGVEQQFGEHIRQENLQRVKQFDAEWERWRQAKAEGTAPVVERLRMPWERLETKQEPREGSDHDKRS